MRKPSVSVSPFLSFRNGLQRAYTPKVLSIYDRGNRNSVSGIRATIFGATGFMGPYIGSVLGYISSDLIFPHCHMYPFDDNVKDLKLCANLGQSFIVKHMNFDDPKMIDRVIRNSNVVVNLVGPRRQIRHRTDFEYANIDIPKRIAEACSRNPGVLRLIHFSAAGAANDSPSLDFQTKIHGEEEVRYHYPSATIFRPTTIYGPNDYFVNNWFTRLEYFYNFLPVFDDCAAKRQPIYASDVALALLNALKMPETAGKTYELGGPHVYSRLEIYEVLHNLIQRPVNLAYFPREVATKLAQVVHNWQHFNLDEMLKDMIDIKVSQGANTIADLCVEPISFPQGVEKDLWQFKAKYMRSKEELETQTGSEGLAQCKIKT